MCTRGAAEERPDVAPAGAADVELGVVSAAGIEYPQSWLHPGCEVRSVDAGGGRGIFAAAPVAPGELVLAERALCAAPSARELAALLRERYGARGERAPPALAAMYAGPTGPGGEGGGFEGIIARNAHALDPQPRDGSLPGPGRPSRETGVFPLASLTNHCFLAPNVARAFTPDGTLQLRCVRPIPAGGEVLDNYQDPRAALGERRPAMRAQHGVDEPADECDAAPQLLREAAAACEHAQRTLDTGDAPAAVIRELQRRCDALAVQGVRDPACCEPWLLLGALAARVAEEGPEDTAAEAGRVGLAAYADALALVTAREARSALSSVVATRLAMLAAQPRLPIAAELRALCLSEARSHFAAVWGGGSSAFAAANPALAAAPLGESRAGADGALAAALRRWPPGLRVAVSAGAGAGRQGTVDAESAEPWCFPRPPVAVAFDDQTVGRVSPARLRRAAPAEAEAEAGARRGAQPGDEGDAALMDDLF
eukprot:TRINITY_DN26529_c0_g1_i2.p1 TRINITY_DN26529_c0_g1~~TRINITY_DN26529_c0_g1_i2.p1  ORF type:complete len:484 (+),score=117.07 TRINITY_DN26529_c0_g1_i2:68-1519(+)